MAVSFSGGRLRRYVMVGSLAHLLERLTELTGRPALPPRWALGYHQSRWGYRSSRQIRQVIDGFAECAIPLSVVHLDIDHMDGYRVFSVDRARFADLEELSAEAAERGARLVTIVDPGVKVDRRWWLYRQLMDHGWHCRTRTWRPARGVVWPGSSVFPDFTAPAVRRWWSDHYRMLVARGVAGAWHDMNEPTSIALWGDRTLPRDARHDLEGRGGCHDEVHNIYGLLMNRSGHRGLAQAAPDRRPFVVSRSGWVGGQRHAWNWTGDSETSWASLRQQIATMVHLGLSGFAFCG